ncbi:MAG: ATP-binding protein [Oligoflexales bacterium]|nr:ATP-binding protein [Oligoflexales bacterium]
MNRIYLNSIRKYLNKKIILISGPRQSGKTTLARMTNSNFDYLNYDNDEDRVRLREKSWDRKKTLIIFDELHKQPKWKQWLKGIYDTEGLKPQIIVTCSAKIDSYRKVGDSLAGRYFHYRIHPLDVREIVNIDPKQNPKTVVENLLKYSGFPEPYLESNQEFYNLWKKSHLDIILRQDLIDLEAVTNIKQIELLIDLLRSRVGSPLSYSSLARDLQVSDKTIKKWLELLENMYVIFKVTPYSKNIARSVLKKPKYYFYDIARVHGDGARIENLVAASLIKEVQYRQDCLGEEWQLHYLAQKGGLEVDFLISKNQENYTLIEVKKSDDNPSNNFLTFKPYFSSAQMVQLVYDLKREKSYPSGVEIRALGKWLVHW